MRVHLLFWTVVVVGACAPGRPTESGVDPGDAHGEPGGSSCSLEGQLRCQGAHVQRCEGGLFRTKKTCLAPQHCAAGLGCVDCPPGGTACMGDAVHECNPDGTFGVQRQVCGAGGCQGGRCADTCSAPGADLIYVVDYTNRLLSFNPRGNANEFKMIGRLNCPAGNPLPGWGGPGPATPFSMSVDRDAQAWVLYTSGEIFWVSTRDASCRRSPFRVGQHGFELFGMGFVSDGPGSNQESLYISGGPAGMVENGQLGRVDKGTLAVSPIGQLPRNEYGPELTGTGAGELYGYFPGRGRSAVMLIDKTNAQALRQWTLAPLGAVARAWAFAHWGGRFYIFITTVDDEGSEVSQVQLLDPASGRQTVVLPSIPYVIVGAGVSTCAPVIIG
ncbi:MAG: hypothetical protein RMK29_21325 [Myxococcales bacterium]|nr:hypothetical protein [Myxococcota bacterium]MDW8284253.1 hypothetical protein [Myxococcales bacterium]